MQHHARPAGSQDHRHGTSRSRNGFQSHLGLAQGFIGNGQGAAIAQQFFVTVTTTATAVTLLAAAVVLDDDADIEPHQRPDIAREHAIGTGHQHGIHGRGQAHHHLDHARIGSAQMGIDFTQHAHLVGIVQTFNRIDGRIQRPRFAHGQAGTRNAATGTGNGPGRTGSFHQGWQTQFIGIGKAGFFPGDGAHAYALLDRMRAGFDDAILHGPAFLPAVLEIQIGKIHARTQQATKGTFQIAIGQSRRQQQTGLGQGQGRRGHAQSRCAMAARSSSSSCRVLSMAVWLKASMGRPSIRVYSPFSVVTATPKIRPSGMP